MRPEINVFWGEINEKFVTKNSVLLIQCRNVIVVVSLLRLTVKLTHGNKTNRKNNYFLLMYTCMLIYNDNNGFTNDPIMIAIARLILPKISTLMIVICNKM